MLFSGHNRRSVLRSALGGAAAAAPMILRGGPVRAGARKLRISHQFPGGSIDHGDFRDRLVRKFAAEVRARTHGELDFEIFPAETLMPAVAQFAALRRGTLDLSLYPLAYAGDEVPELNIGLMPMLVTTYGQGYAWKSAEIGRALLGLLEQRGVKLLTWIWQAGGCASHAAAVVDPDDVRGMKIRGGSRDMDIMFAAAGGLASAMPSDAIHAAMQSGALDAAVTSSTSLISFQLQEVSKNVTSGRDGGFWFMLEPFLMSLQVFESLTADQRKIVVDVAAFLEGFGFNAARGDDELLAVVYGHANVKVMDFPKEALAKWRAVAEGSAWRDFAARSSSCAEMLKSAQAVGV